MSGKSEMSLFGIKKILLDQAKAEYNNFLAVIINESRDNIRTSVVFLQMVQRTNNSSYIVA